MYTAFSPGTKNLFLVLSAACCIVAFFLMAAMRKEQKRRKWICGILLCILVAMIKLMGSETTEIAFRPGKELTVIMMVGLQLSLF